MTLKEYARIQEFPDDWEFIGSPAQQYAQVGNAVPIRLGMVAGETIASAMDKLAGKNWEPQRKDLEAYRVIYVQSHVRTRHWYRQGQTFVWEDGLLEGNNGQYSAPVTKRRVKQLKVA